MRKNRAVLLLAHRAPPPEEVVDRIRTVREHLPIPCTHRPIPVVPRGPRIAGASLGDGERFPLERAVKIPGRAIFLDMIRLDIGVARDEVELFRELRQVEVTLEVHPRVVANRPRVLCADDRRLFLCERLERFALEARVLETENGKRRIERRRDLIPVLHAVAPDRTVPGGVELLERSVLALQPGAKARGAVTARAVSALGVG